MKKVLFSLAVALSFLLSACATTGTCEAARPPVFESPIQTPATWSFVCGFPEEKREIVRQGVQFWNKELGREILREVPVDCREFPDIDQIPNVVFYYRPLHEQPDGEGGVTLAVTMRWRWSRLITGAAVTMLLDWFKEEDDVAEEVVRHEVGHVLGFNHMRNPQCLMYKFVGDGSKGLCPAERKIFERVYGKDRRPAE